MGEGWNWSRALNVFTSVLSTEHGASVRHKIKRREWELGTEHQNWGFRTNEVEWR